MTVIFKHLSVGGDSPSPSSFAEEPRAGVGRRFKQKSLMTKILIPAPFHLGPLGAGPAPQWEQRRPPLKDTPPNKKGEERETLVMDKPVVTVSVGEPGVRGLWWGWRGDWQLPGGIPHPHCPGL